VIERLWRAASPVESRSTLRDPSPWLVEALGGSKTVGPVLSPGESLSVVAVFAAARVVSETIAALPLIVYRDGPQGRERAGSAWQSSVLGESPNPEQSGFVFRQILASHIELWGNAYVEKVKTRSGLVAELWLVHPSRVKVERDGQGRKRFRVDGGEVTLGADTILHVPGFSVDNLVGLSPVSICRQQISVMGMRAEHEASLLKRGARFGGVIERPKDAPRWTDEAAERFTQQWQAAWGQGGHRAGGTPILQDGMTFKATVMPLKDLEFIESRRADVQEVARMFGLPPSMIGGATGDSLTYGNREQDATMLLTYSIAPRLKRIEGALMRDADLFGGSGLYAEHLIDGLLRADSKTRSEVYATALDEAHGWMTRAEVRRLENLPAEPAGNGG
jgi:HK97 family phage portal protein